MGTTGEVVSGIFTDEVAGRDYLLVQQIDDAAASHHQQLFEIISEARKEHSAEALTVLLRRNNGKTPPGEWSPHTSYLAFDGEPDEEPPSGITIEEHHPDQDVGRFVRQWLIQALRANYGEGLDHAAASRWVDALFSSEASSSFIAYSGVEPVGHLTVEYGVPDACSEIPTTEIIDVLIDLSDCTLKSAAERSLVAAAARAANDRREPLVGDVVHRPEAAEDPTGRVVELLESRGWSVAYRIWQLKERS